MALLNNKEFQIGPVTFRVWELPNPTVFCMLEKIRVNLSVDDLADVSITDLTGMQLGTEATAEQVAARDQSAEALIKLLLGIVLKLDESFVQWLKARLFEHTDFQSAATGGKWLKLTGANVEMAFDRSQPGVGPLSMHKVLVEGFRLNFFGSGEDVMQHLGLGGASSDQAEAT